MIFFIFYTYITISFYSYFVDISYYLSLPSSSSLKKKKKKKKIKANLVPGGILLAGHIAGSNSHGWLRYEGCGPGASDSFCGCISRGVLVSVPGSNYFPVGIKISHVMTCSDMVQHCERNASSNMVQNCIILAVIWYKNVK